jgi:catechol 2,3-dioxygenase-like lactoylglutathione lyase family enzyme
MATHPRRRATPAARPALTFNHAMIYTADVARSSAFYASLGFRVLAVQPPYYARLRAPRGTATIALHLTEPGHDVAAPGMRLYFEVASLLSVCRRLQKQGLVFKEMPVKRPWGWTHAYLDDPDGHEVSLYWAGPQRLKRG